MKGTVVSLLLLVALGGPLGCSPASTSGQEARLINARLTDLARENHDLEERLAALQGAQCPDGFVSMGRRGGALLCAPEEPPALAAAPAAPPAPDASREIPAPSAGPEAPNNASSDASFDVAASDVEGLSAQGLPAPVASWEREAPGALPVSSLEPEASHETAEASHETAEAPREVAEAPLHPEAPGGVSAATPGLWGPREHAPKVPNLWGARGTTTAAPGLWGRRSAPVLWASVDGERSQRVEIITDPPGAHVFVDGVRRCASPCVFELVSRPGHAPRLELRRPGYQPHHSLLEGQRGAVRLQVTLKPAR